MSSAPAPIVLLGASYAGGWQLPPVAGRPVVNKGVAGQQSWEMLERFDRDVVASHPSAVIVWGYINDIFRSSREDVARAQTRARASFEEMIRKARAAGIEPIVATEVPMSQNESWSEWLAWLVGSALGKQSYQDYINARVTELNAWLRDVARREHILLLDLHGAVADARGNRRKGLSNEDGSHISPAGYAALTQYAVPLLESHFRQPARFR